MENASQNPPPCINGHNVSVTGSGEPVRARVATSSRFATGGMPSSSLPLPPIAEM